MKRAVFFERDSLLVLSTPGLAQRAPMALDQLALQQSALPGLQRLKAAGFVLIATTNQPELSDGSLCRRELDVLHDRLRRTFALDDILICPHGEEDHCPCRKPNAGLFHEASFKFHLSLGQSFVLSHRWQDAEAARVIGATSYLIESPWLGRGRHNFVARDLEAAVEKLLERERLLHRVA